LRPERSLRWEGCCNIRDLGGLPTQDGGETVFGRVVRADTPSTLSQAGWEALAAYGIRRIVDLRHEDPPHDIEIDVVRVPLAEMATWAEVDRMLEGVDDPVEWRRRNYLFFLDRFPGRFADAIAAVAQAPDGPVLVHCAGGVDRTGLVAALILRVADVSVETVAADYAESEANWAPLAGEWIHAALDEAESRKRRFLSQIPGDVMEQVLDELEREHGDVPRYLLAAGLSEDDLERLRARLRE
jgi:hypothetical protein